MMSEYLNILIMYFVCIIITLLIFIISYTAMYKNFNWEKISSYECGFQPFDDARNRFDVKFYLVAILFIIFDLEIAYLFPWSLCLDEFGLDSIVSMLVFLSILTLGFIYEWKKGALEWY